MAKDIKNIKYNSKDKAVVEALKANPEGLTLAEINEATGLSLVAGNITSIKNKHLIENVGKRPIERQGSHKVCTYIFVTNEPAVKDGKQATYTESEQEIMKAANIDGEFTLNELSEKVGRKLVPGSISGLIRKGNLAKTENKVDEPCIVRSTTSVYVLLNDIPEDATITD